MLRVIGLIFMSHTSDSSDDLAAERNIKCHLLPIGGSTALGAWGYIDAFAELLEQGLADKFDDLVVTCGSGGTGMSAMQLILCFDRT